jgi:NTP pyrophosphatase (non-canonical NTP hydrolase)
VELREFQAAANHIRDRYATLNEQEGRVPWGREDFMLGFVGDVGDLAKIVMGLEGKRSGPYTLEALEHELSDCLWSVLILAQSYDIDLEAAFGRTMGQLEQYIGAALDGSPSRALE